MADTATDITEAMIRDVREVLEWYMSPLEAADAAPKVLAAAALVEPRSHQPEPDHGATTRPHHNRHTGVVGNAAAGNTVTVTLPDPAAPGTRAWLRTNFGEVVVDDGRRCRSLTDAEQDGLALLAAARQGTSISPSA